LQFQQKLIGFNSLISKYNL